MTTLYLGAQQGRAESRELAAKSASLVSLGERGEALDTAIQAFLVGRTSEARQAIAGSFPQVITELNNAGFVSHAAFSPDGQRVVTTSYAVTSAARPIGLDNSGMEDAVKAATQPSVARVWDAVSGRAISKLEGHASAITHAAFSPDGQRVVMAALDGTARVWSVDTGQVISTLEAPPATSIRLRFRRTGKGW